MPTRRKVASEKVIFMKKSDLVCGLLAACEEAKNVKHRPASAMLSFAAGWIKAEGEACGGDADAAALVIAFREVVEADRKATATAEGRA